MAAILRVNGTDRIKPELRKRPDYVKFEKEDIDEILKL